MNKTLVIVRHAHRDKDQGSSADNGLSEKGLKQAKRIAEFFKARFGFDSRPALYSSPKKRCQETLAPLALKLKTELEVLPSLNEASTSGELDQHISDFRYFWETSQEPLTVICSHGDFIPRYLEAVLGTPIPLSKGAWAELESGVWSKKPVLTWLVQDLTHFI